MHALTEFEVAVLGQIAYDNPQYDHQLMQLIQLGQVAAREFTAAGGFIEFGPNSIEFQPAKMQLDIDAVIELPCVEHGMGALLFVREARASTLEVYTYGENEWWGDATGFVIVPAQITRGGGNAT
jgi:hypothetical protein